jgi:hypothetical protein
MPAGQFMPFIDEGVLLRAPALLCDPFSLPEGILARSAGIVPTGFSQA